MGQICAKLRNPDYSRQAEENIRSPFHQLDSITLPVYPERQLKFYRDLDDKFSVLSNILLSDFMTLLNNLSGADAAAAGKQRNIKTDKITKNDWNKFCENKILKNPFQKEFKTQIYNKYKLWLTAIAFAYLFFYIKHNYTQPVIKFLN